MTVCCVPMRRTCRFKAGTTIIGYLKPLKARGGHMIYDTYDLETVAELDEEKLKGLKSPYWDGGFHQETFSVRSASVMKKTIKAICTQPTFYTSPYDTKYHLSVPILVGFIAQVGIIHAHALKGEMRKTTEALMTDFQLKIGKMIGCPTEIPVEMNILRLVTSPPKGKRKSPRTYFEWRFSVGEAWWGMTTIVFSV